MAWSVTTKVLDGETALVGWLPDQSGISPEVTQHCVDGVVM